MSLIIYKHYKNKEQAEQELQSNTIDGNQTIVYVSGKDDIMMVLKELIKSEWQ